MMPSQNGYILDGNGDVRLVSSTARALRKRYSRMTMDDQESFDLDTIVLRTLLGLKPDHVYVVQDLEDADILDPALRLLYRVRFGQKEEYARISPHIKYDKLSRKMCNAIEKKTNLQNAEIQQLGITTATGHNKVDLANGV